MRKPELPPSERSFCLARGPSVAAEVPTNGNPVEAARAGPFEFSLADAFGAESCEFWAPGLSAVGAVGFSGAGAAGAWLLLAGGGDF